MFEKHDIVINDFSLKMIKMTILHMRTLNN